MADEDLKNSLNELISLMNRSNELAINLERVVVQQGTSDKAEKKLSRRGALAQMQTAMQIPVLGKTFRNFGKGIADALKSGLDLQKKGLARGQTLGSIMDRNAITTNYLSDNLTGFSNALGVGFEMYEVGMRTNNKEVARLALQTKLTGGNSQKLLKSLARNTEGLGLTQEQLSSLSDKTLGLAQTYGLTTDELMRSIDSLSKNLSTYAALGIAAEMQEAGLSLAAAVGPAIADIGPDLLKTFTQGDRMIQASLLGITRERQAMLKGEGDATRAAFDMMIKAGQQAEKIIENYTRGAADPAFALARAADVFGQETMEAKRYWEGLKEAARELGISVDKHVQNVVASQKVSDEFQNTWENFMQKVWHPVQYAMTEIATAILKVLSWGPMVHIVQAVIGLTVALFGLTVVMRAALLILKTGRGQIAREFGRMRDWVKPRGRSPVATGGKQMQLPFGKKATAPGGGLPGAPAGATGPGMFSKLGQGLKGLFSSIGPILQSLGKGFGGMIRGVLVGISDGVKSFSSGKLFKGALGIALVGASLLPFVFGLKMMKNVGVGQILLLAGALVTFSMAAFGLGMLIGTGVGGVAFMLGVAGIAALGTALIPFAGALFLVGSAVALGAPGLRTMGDVLAKLETISILRLLALGPALASVAAGFTALAVAGAAASVVGLDVNALARREGSANSATKRADKSVASRAGSANSATNRADKSVELLEQVIVKLDTANEQRGDANEQREEGNALKMNSMIRGRIRPSELKEL